MNTLTFKPLAEKLSFDADNLWVEMRDGRHLGVPLAYFPRLLGAGRGQLENYVISGGGTGLHWDELDEDISVKSLLLGIGDRTLYADRLRKKAS
ncbi:MAG: DUF2442 domain-containing protein [Deltaproteobacteria bacterium]|nr:MAG: DUF2442 domain-containing protein [Deltaproteobacteria bacterium]